MSLTPCPFGSAYSGLALGIQLQTPDVRDSQIILATIDYLCVRSVPPEMSNLVIRVADLLAKGEDFGNVPSRLKISHETFRAALSLIADAAAHAGWAVAFA